MSLLIGLLNIIGNRVQGARVIEGKPPIWVEYIVARAGDFSLPAYNTMQENIVTDTDHLVSVQLYDSDNELVANLRPCLSTEKGHYLEGCLYDVVKKKFYYSQNADVKYGDIVREVEYIESTGSQCILVDNINLNRQMVINIDFQLKSFESSEIDHYIMISDNAWVDYSTNTYLVFCRFFNLTSTRLHFTSLPTIYDRIYLHIGNGFIKINDKNYALPEATESTENDSIYIFGRTLESSHGFVIGKIYSFVITNNKIYQCDLMPCILSDGTVCMWDWISGEAKKNAGTGEFVAGKDMNDLFNVVEKQGVFLNRTTGDGLNVKDKSLAHITSLKGNTLMWNQLILNGDFSNGRTDWVSTFSTAPIFSVTDGVLTIEKSASGGTGNWLQQSSRFTTFASHKYYISAIIRNDNDTTPISVSFYNTNYTIGTNLVIFTTSQTPTRVSAVGSPQADGNQLALRVGSSIDPQGTKGYFSNVMCIDLTLMFGAGNEPATAEEFEAMFSADYYDYDAGSLLNVDAGGIKSTDVGKTKWDSLYFVDNTHTLSSLTGKAEGSSVSEVIFPKGMKRAGNVYDELTDVKDGCFTKAVKRIGVRAYQTGDEDDTTVKTDGTNTYYTLSNATVYTLDTPVPCNYKVWKGGSEIVTPENTEALTAPVDMSVKYIVEEDE